MASISHLIIATIASSHTFVVPSVFSFQTNIFRQIENPARTSILASSSLLAYNCDDHEVDYKSLDRRLGSLEQTLPESIAGFYEPNLNSFSVRPGSERFSITSTLFALECFQYDSFDQLPATNHNKSNFVQSLLKATLHSDWDEKDLFQVPLLIRVVLSMDSERDLFKDMNEHEARRVKELIQAVLDARPLRRSGQVQQLSDYLIFLCGQAMIALHDSTDVDDFQRDQGADNDNQTGIGRLPVNMLPENSSSLLLLSLSRCVEVSFNELCRQLAYRNSGDRNNFDIMRLAYSLLTYVTTSNTMSGNAGIELVPGEGPASGSVVGPPNDFLVKEALKAFFDEQNDDGLWDKGQPIYKSFRKTGRNVGNAFVFATDTVCSLLRTLPAEYFRPHMSALENMLTWIEAHLVVEVIPNYCDPVSNKCYGKMITGWSSPHLTPGQPQAWSTAQTISCILEMRQTVRELMHYDVLTEFGGIPNRRGSRENAWDRLLDTDLSNPSQSDCRTLKSVLEERVLIPFSSSVSMPSFGAAYSCILFGPPGTAKTTICEALAERMGWDFLVIDTSVFLADGLTNVASRIRYVFDKLMQLDKCVILFDEIEEFCLDRENPGLGMESRMLTTAMLTAINDLRRKKRSIFFLATNRLRAFDSAITRPGRFDMQLFVGTPNVGARCVMLSNKLDAANVDNEVKVQALQVYRSFLEDRWDKDAMFMNYLEGLQFASLCMDVIALDGLLTNAKMENILQSQAAVMTVRGSLRDEYMASLKLSRL